MLTSELAAGARFLTQLPGFLRRRIEPAQAATEVADRLATRARDFLALARDAIYGHPASPYRALLAHAGCAYGDLEHLVQRDGLDAALRTLCRQGVYLTVDELKGRAAAVRGSATVAVDPTRLRNPRGRAPIPAQTSGSGGPRTLVPIDLAYVHDCAVDSCLMFEARGGRDWVKGHWAPLGGGAMMSLLQLSAFGAPSARWFTQVDPRTATLHPRYRWAATAMAWTSRLAGVPLPHPEYVPTSDPQPIARWLADELRQGRVPHLLTYPSAAAGLCAAARAAGIAIAGAQFTISGEAATAARQQAIRAAGGDVLPRYGAVETGPIGFGCLRAEAVDEMHVLSDLHAVVQLDGVGASGLPVGALYLTALRPSAPFVLLNACLGDEGVLTARRCGCAFEARGWDLHLHTIRSFEKLTGAGMTLLDADVVRILDAVLPARFGGSGADYQLAEEEAEDGAPRLRLIVHPRLGPLDAGAVARVFLDAVAANSSTDQVMGAVWRGADLIRVERSAPTAAASGKVLHLLRRRR
ncbi:MAG: hypothetical protein SF182_22650 [Deltaproteobacteria bacterium]|nr:hypothetical protein [Deltaproteobacteria bacterium]